MPDPNATVAFINRGASLHSIPIGSKIGSNMQGDLSQTGFIFDGWYTTAGKKVTANTIVNQDISAHARWRVTVSFETNGGVAIDPITPIENQAIGALPTACQGWQRFCGLV